VRFGIHCFCLLLSQQPGNRPNPGHSGAGPLAPGATVNISFRFGLMKGGFFRFYVNIEAVRIRRSSTIS
jgi:hypothetical protein